MYILLGDAFITPTKVKSLRNDVWVTFDQKVLISKLWIWQKWTSKDKFPMSTSSDLHWILFIYGVLVSVCVCVCAYVCVCVCVRACMRVVSLCWLFIKDVQPKLLSWFWLIYICMFQNPSTVKKKPTKNNKIKTKQNKTKQNKKCQYQQPFTMSTGRNFTFIWIKNVYKYKSKKLIQTFTKF